jgi:hypothetical protein
MVTQADTLSALAPTKILLSEVFSDYVRFGPDIITAE